MAAMLLGPGGVLMPTPGFHGHSVQFSPFEENKLAIATAQHFGIVGNGRLYIVGFGPAGASVVGLFDTQDGLYDLAWSELNENQIVTASGDGALRLFDAKIPNQVVQLYGEHRKEVHGVNWNLTRKDSFVSASWDMTCKLWIPERPASLATFVGHEAPVYSAMWSPHAPDVFATASADCTLRVWDIKSPRAVQVIPAHTNEVLTLDWNKYRPNIVATGSVDTSIRIWDLRVIGRPLAELRGHSFAVRRLKYSPHAAEHLVSASYDMTVAVWNTDAPDPLLFVHDRHTEFVCGVDFNLYLPGQLATSSWDETTHIFTPPCFR